jgi:hypothetical protein
MQQFVSDDEVLKSDVLIGQIVGKRDDSVGRARTPFPSHALDADNPGLCLKPLGPVLDTFTKVFAPMEAPGLSISGQVIAPENPKKSGTCVSHHVPQPSIRCHNIVVRQ